jgi:hypothetical protein
MFPSRIRFSSFRVALALAGVTDAGLIAIIPFLVTIIGSMTSGTDASAAQPAKAVINATDGAEHSMPKSQNDQYVQTEEIGMVRSDQPKSQDHTPYGRFRC